MERKIEGWYEQNRKRIFFKGEIAIDVLTNKFKGKTIEESERMHAEIAGIIKQGKINFTKNYCEVKFHPISYFLFKHNENEFFGAWRVRVVDVDDGDYFRTLGIGKAALFFS